MTGQRERQRGRPGWWVFDTPLLRDHLWWACMTTAVVAGTWAAWNGVRLESGAAAQHLAAFAGAALQVWLTAAVVLGSVRAYRRARAVR